MNGQQKRDRVKYLKRKAKAGRATVRDLVELRKLSPKNTIVPAAPPETPSDPPPAAAPEELASPDEIAAEVAEAVAEVEVEAADAAAEVVQGVAAGDQGEAGPSPNEPQPGDQSPQVPGPISPPAAAPPAPVGLLPKQPVVKKPADDGMTMQITGVLSIGYVRWIQRVCNEEKIAFLPDEMIDAFLVPNCKVAEKYLQKKIDKSGELSAVGALVVVSAPMVYIQGVRIYRKVTAPKPTPKVELPPVAPKNGEAKQPVEVAVPAPAPPVDEKPIPFPVA